MGKNNEYLEISKQIVANIGGMDNIQGTAHCATRLRIVLCRLPSKTAICAMFGGQCVT